MVRVRSGVPKTNGCVDSGKLCPTTRQRLFFVSVCLPHQEEVVEFLLPAPALFNPVELELTKSQILENLAVLPDLIEDLNLRHTPLL
jgi:hypothetical protein